MARASSKLVAVPPAGWGISSRPHRAFQRSRSSARSIDSGEVPSTSSGGNRPASFNGVWPPRETITPTTVPVARLDVDDVADVLPGDRLEVQAVAGVVVGGDRLGVAVDHHRLVAGVVQGEAGLHAAVVELDALADPVGAGADDDDLGPIARRHLVVVLVGRVVVGRVGLELRRAGVDRLHGGPHPGGQAGLPDRGLVDRPQPGQLGVGEAEPLGPAPVRRGPAQPGRRRPARRARSSTIRSIWSRNHGSTPVAS